MVVQICVGSSCHLKGSSDIVEFFQNEVEANHLEDKITLAGNFCTGRCNREGVTIQVDGEVFAGITKENVKEFYKEKVLAKLERE